MATHALRYDVERSSLARWLAVGAVAGALAVILFHQPVAALLHAAGLTPRAPYSMQATKPFGIAQIWSIAFWGAVWGPVGLVLSTPLTLCLVVAGRHVRALRPISILFGDSPGSTHARQLYQRSLAGELREMQDEARAWLRRRSFASYCDNILLPAASLAGSDHQAGRLHEPQLRALRQSMIGLVE